MQKKLSFPLELLALASLSRKNGQNWKNWANLFWKNVCFETRLHKEDMPWQTILKNKLGFRLQFLALTSLVDKRKSAGQLISSQLEGTEPEIGRENSVCLKIADKGMVWYFLEMLYAWEFAQKVYFS